MSADSSRLNVLMCKSNLLRLQNDLHGHDAHRSDVTQVVLCVPSLYGQGGLLLDDLQGEYTTGWTGSGASKSDKKVRPVDRHALICRLLIRSFYNRSAYVFEFRSQNKFY